MDIMIFFFNDTATTEIYTLSLHDALPISEEKFDGAVFHAQVLLDRGGFSPGVIDGMAGMSFEAALKGFQTARRSEEHTSELQSRQYLVCRLLLEKKKNPIFTVYISRSH